MTTRTPQQILDDIEPNLIKEGYIPRVVELPKGARAEFWTTRHELRVEGPSSTTSLPYFDPTGKTDDELREKIRTYLTFS
jgi:hypothetical protein